MINELIKKAQGEIGYKEGSNNNTKYGKAYGMNNNPWCMMFVWWCANEAGIGTSIIPKTASCPTAYKWFKNKNQIIKNSEVKKGDIVFFTWNNSNNADHVGIIEKVEGNIFTTIEGNKNDAVERRQVSKTNSCIYGIARPTYDENESTSSNTSTKSETEKDRIKALQTALNKDFKCSLEVDGIIGPKTTSVVMSHYLKYYTSGNFVKWTQTHLIRQGYSVGSCGIDGGYGKDTVATVKKYQKEKKLTVDGYVGIEVVKSLVK